MHGPASITVTGITVPFGPNTWVMPTFLPNNPLSISFPLFSTVYCVSLPYGIDHKLQFDLDIHTCGQIQPCQRLYCFVCRLNDIDQTLVSANLELIAGIF